MRRRFAGVAAAAVVAMATFGACGGDDGGPDVASLGGATADSADARSDDQPKRSFEDAMLEYARCMRRNGVDMPDPSFAGDGGGVAVIGRAPGGTGSGPSRAAVDAAEEECGPILHAAQRDMPKPSPEEQARMRDHAVGVARCMRGKGFDMPDPTFDDDGSVRVQIESRGGDAPGDGDEGSAPAPAREPDPAFMEAMESCQEQNGGPPLGATRQEER